MTTPRTIDPSESLDDKQAKLAAARKKVADATRELAELEAQSDTPATAEPGAALHTSHLMEELPAIR